VVKTFSNLELELRAIIRQQVRGSIPREQGTRLAEEIVTLVRSRWDNAPSLHHWWTQMHGADLSAVPLNSLYERLGELGVEVKQVLHALAQAYGWLTTPLLIVDDTSAHKYGVWMQGVSSVRVANVKGSVLGHNVVTLMLACPEGALFLNHEVKVNPSQPRLARHKGRPIDEVRASRRTKKWEMALELIRHARENGVDAAWVLFDCAYFNAGSEVPKRLTADNVTFITKAKKSDKFVIDGIEMTAREFQTLCESWKRVRQTDHFFYQKKAVLKDGTPVKIVATWFFRGTSLKKSLAVLVTNGVDIPGALVVLTYLQRWETERGYQDWKRSMGGMAYHSTDFHKMQSYIGIGFLAYALARRARQLLGTKLGLPTLLAVRRRTVQTMIATRKVGTGIPEDHDQMAA
jgi:hypothetical protein